MQPKVNLLAMSFDGLLDKVVEYLPNVLQAGLIFIVGLLLGLAIKFLLSRIFRMTKLDQLADRTGANELNRRIGIKSSFSGVLARIFAGMVVVLFGFAAIVNLHIPAAEKFFEKLLFYLPNLFAAGLILLFGYILGNFIGRTVLIAAVNAGIRVSGSVGRLIRGAVMILASTMALEQLGIGGETIVLAFGIFLGGIVLALALAFGLAAKDIVRKYMEDKIDGIAHREEISHL